MKRHLVSLLIAMLFVTLAVTGIMGFFLPFNLLTVSVHSLVGFLFIGAIGLHLQKNFRQLRGYFSRPAALVLFLFVAGLIAFILWQPGPVRALLGLSRNLGPEMDRFEMKEDGMVFQYAPSQNYKMMLTVKTGPAYDLENPPQVAIWLENRNAHHIKTLLEPDDEQRKGLPYWSFKRAGWQKAKKEAGETAGEEIDAISEPTPQGSFDPADYILPDDPENSAPYSLLIEVNQPNDAHDRHPDQPSLVYTVEIDNLYPSGFQLLDLVGYPQRNDEDGREAWSLFYVDDTFGSALDLIDSALLTIDRGSDSL